MPVTETGIVRRFCLVAGIVMVVFVLFWNSFIFCAWRGTEYVAEECQQGTKGQKARKEACLNNRSATTLFGLLSLGLLGICIILEVCGTGLVWWTSQQLGDQYQVVGDCFCSQVPGHVTSAKRNDYNVECPVVEGLVCKSLYNAVSTVTKRMFTMTRECQMLDGIQLNQTCLEYKEFWNLFKVLRILLPVLALIKLPVLLLNCNRWLCKEERQNTQVRHGKFAADSISWIGQDVLLSPLRLVDPVQFYSNMCAPLDNQPPLGERLGPVGQEAGKDHHLTQPSNICSPVATISKAPSPRCYNQPVPLSAVHCPVPPFKAVHEESCSSQVGITKDDSPPDIEDHTVSTPIHPRLRTPSFDLSKVVKPVYLDTSTETTVPISKLNLKPPVALPRSRVSSFRSAPPPPPLPKPDTAELYSDELHPRPPFLRSTQTLPRPVRITSTDSNSTVPKPGFPDPLCCNHLSPPPTPRLLMDPPSGSDYDTSGSVKSVTPLVRYCVALLP